MFTQLPPIYFYLPKQDWRSDIPDTADTYWEGFSRGIYCWTLQTYLRLHDFGFPCQLVNTFPDEGIVIAHRESLNYELTPTQKTLLVCLKADQATHPYAQLHIVQNPQEAKSIRKSLHIPLWSQPGLIPRSPARGSRVENIRYFGISHNLAPELKDPTWAESLKKIGLNWQIRPRESWHDYSDTDVIVAVRNFQQLTTYTWKPATKLYNSWHACVPAILGCESAFQSERKGKLDYFQVQSPEEIIDCLTHLKRNPGLFNAMVDNGRLRAHETDKRCLTEKWKNALLKFVIPEYERWRNLPRWRQHLYTNQCHTQIKLKALKRRFSLGELAQ